MSLKHIYQRTIYLAYYAKQMNWNTFRRFLTYADQVTGSGHWSLLVDSVRSVYLYNIGWIDYFYFRFFEKSEEERSAWVGTGYKYEYDLVMNPVKERHILQNKLNFFPAFAPFIQHAMCRIEDLAANNEAARKVLENSSGKIAVKDALGQCGWSVEILQVADFTRPELLNYMRKRSFNMAEEFIVQHPDLAKLSPAGLNTVRLITQLNDRGGVDFIGPTLRMTVNAAVDNMAMGNIAAPIDLATGRICGKGTYQDITKPAVAIHPVTKIKLSDYSIPYWKRVLDLCEQAALSNTSNKSIGWDIAITDQGPALLEGNHNWCKLLWQLPLGKGMKKHLEHYRLSAVH